MSGQRFDARVDATPAVANGWLRPGERLDWTCHRQRIEYEVKGRKPNGKPRAHPALRVLGWILLSPLMLILLLGEMFSESTNVNDWSDAPYRGVVAKGPHRDCTAARLADVTAEQSFWVLTDRRFALVAAEPVPGQPHSPTVRLRTVWELPAEQYVYHPPVTGTWRRHASPARVAFGDGSSLGFLGAPGR